MIGLILLMPLYSTWSQEDLFTPASHRRRGFSPLSDLSKYMTLRRFKHLKRHVTFCDQPPASLPATETAPAFWRIQPLIDAFNQNGKDGFVAGDTTGGNCGMAAGHSAAVLHASAQSTPPSSMAANYAP